MNNKRRNFNRGKVELVDLWHHRIEEFETHYQLISTELLGTEKSIEIV
jgi:hypothetical protein